MVLPPLVADDTAIVGCIRDEEYRSLVREEPLTAQHLKDQGAAHGQEVQTKVTTSS